MISVIIPVYNMEDYLRICLNSVLKQTFKNFEIICIDDDSNDSSLEILEYFSQKDDRVKIIKNNINKGQCYCKNQGLYIAQGEYITFLDADDWFSPNSFEILYKIMENNQLDILMFNNICYYDELNDFKLEDYYPKEFLNIFSNKVFNHFNLDKHSLFDIPHDSTNKIYLKSFLDKNEIHFPDENIIYGDFPFVYSAMTAAKRISLINDCLYVKRKKINSIFDSNKKFFDFIDVSYLIFNVFKQNFQLYQYYKSDLLNHIFQKLLNDNHDKLKGKTKENFFNQVQTILKHFIKDYELYMDISDNVEKSILYKFNFEEILEELSHYQPKISIIVPIFNAEEFLERCLNSVINQSMKDIEVICINDGSYDNSLNILNKFRNNDYRVNVFSQKNMGVAIARNNGITKANGEYVLFVDSDDWIEQDMCVELYHHAKHLDSDLILFDATEHNLDNEFRNRVYFTNDSFNEDFKEFTFDYSFNKKLVLNHFLVVWSKMYKKDLINGIEFPNLPLFEDVSFHIKSMLLAEKISYFPNEFYHYMKLNTKSEQNFKVKTDKSLCIVDVFKEVHAFLIENNFFDEFQINFLTFILKESINIFDRIDENYKQVLFKNIKLFYSSLNINLDLLEKLPSVLSEFFNNIINSENYFEFQSLHDYSMIKHNINGAS